MKALAVLLAIAVEGALLGIGTGTAMAGQQGDVAAGKSTYTKLCASCHGAKGDGSGPAAAALPKKPRAFTDAKYMASLTDEHLFKVIKEGGAAVGKSALMPAWGGQLKDKGIHDLVAYIRTLAKPAK